MRNRYIIVCINNRTNNLIGFYAKNMEITLNLGLAQNFHTEQDAVIYANKLSACDKLNYWSAISFYMC